MTNKDHPPSELPLPCVLDDDDIDRLLERLRAVHGEPRRDIAPELNRQVRVSRDREHGFHCIVSKYFAGS
jgi:hypothetical protein